MSPSHAWFGPLVALMLGTAAAQGLEVTIDRKSLETYVDRVVTAYQQAVPLRGVAFAFVSGDQVDFAKGYGSADESTARPVDGTETRFRVASLSKPVVATAILQLVERGALDLHADVNRYLRGFQIPDGGLGPITLHHLLTHTAGFDDRNVGRAMRAGQETPSVADYLAWALPARVFPPGEICSYSNYGFSLLGYVIEVASGLPFEQYVAQNVFAPLGMVHSTFAPARAAELARGHEWVGGRWSMLEDSWDIAGAAANLSTSAHDLGRFMIAHLNGGVVEGHRVLNDATLATMHAQQHTHHTGLAGTCYGWFERLQNGWRLLEHSGHWTGFSSRIVIAPEVRIGFALTTNCESSGWYVMEMADRFIDQFLTDRRGEVATPVAVDPGHATEVAGVYRPTAFARHDLERITSVFGTYNVAPVDGATVRFRNVEFVETAPMLFAPRGADLPMDPGSIAFRRVRGQTYLFAGHDSYERVPWHETTTWLLVFVGLLGLAFLGSALLWLGARLRSRRGVETTGTGGLAAVLGTMHLVWLGVLAVAVQHAVGSNGGEFAFGIPAWAAVLLSVPLVGAALAAILVWRTVRALRARRGSAAARFGACAAVVANLGWFALLMHWNLFGIHG